jgi:thioredoxin-dependent peroxiredoxin
LTQTITNNSLLRTVAMLIPFCSILAVIGCEGRCDKMEEQTRERAGAVVMKGKPLTLVGNELKVGDLAPDVELTANDLSGVKISLYRGKTCIISAVPSLDTPVCSIETRRFNEEASKLGDDVVILTVSMDLPFAQKRWCGAEGVDRVITLSDYRDKEFGKAYGVLIKELVLLARTVFVVDKQGVIRYIQQVKEQSTEPDYNAVLAAVNKLK